LKRPGKELARAHDAIKQYRREWDEKLQRFKDVPLHDWSSDFADGLSYLARGRKPFPNQTKREIDLSNYMPSGGGFYPQQT
jgi:hypothetical protein